MAAHPEGVDVPSSERTFRRYLPLEAAIARLAEVQHGVVSLEQVMALGISASAVRNRAQDGRLHRVVYAVRHPGLNPRGRWMAATLAGGPEALLSHRAAAALCGLWPGAMPAAEITLPPGARVRPGIQVHRSRTVTEADRARQDGIPCTSVARTLVDLGDVAGRRTGRARREPG